MKKMFTTILCILLATAAMLPLHGQNTSKLTGNEILQLSDQNRNGWTFVFGDDHNTELRRQ